MGKFTFEKTPIAGVYVITPTFFGDNRGGFMETYNQEDFQKAGIAVTFVQDNQAFSHKGVLRGMHFQIKHPQAKLVRALKGLVFDAVVDLRSSSETFGQWFGVLLSEENKKQLFVPKGFAHGYLVLSEEAEIAYKCDDFYHPEEEGGLLWNDETVGIQWPDLPAGVSHNLNDRDLHFPTLQDIKKMGSPF
ncbi:MAG: dTDP-4-dehydrorhamnose 3,5-epimerase [Clostridia bacterium]|nr:dTDP-4-dehydrorhamnose 3,5-epimerase [Clostridia bacterium]